MGEAGELGPDHEIETNRGTRSFAEGDRLLFLRNERNLGVKNGTLGTVGGIKDGRLSVTTDDGRTVAVDPATYKDIDHGYAVTVHKSQGVTVDRHLAYVSMSRHREWLTMVHSHESFKDEHALARTFSRARLKDTTLDYRETRTYDQADREALKRDIENCFGPDRRTPHQESTFRLSR